MIIAPNLSPRIALTPDTTLLSISKPESLHPVNVGSNINNWRISLRFFTTWEPSSVQIAFCHFFLSCWAVPSFHPLDEITNRDLHLFLYQHSWLSHVKILHWCNSGISEGYCIAREQAHPCTFIYFQFQDVNTIKENLPLSLHNLILIMAADRVDFLSIWSHDGCDSPVFRVSLHLLKISLPSLNVKVFNF